MAASYWLMKSEPSVYSIDDLKRDGRTIWEGVRNYQARNMMRDAMKPGDPVFFYHSNAEPPGIAGIAEVASAAYPDPSAFDRKSPYYDAKSKRESPAWVVVDIKFRKRFKQVVSLEELRQLRGLENMPLLRKGQRLSVQPVSAAEWKRVCEYEQKRSG